MANLPKHDLILADRPDETTEVYTYFFKDAKVMVCTVKYADAEHKVIESIEYDNGA